MADNLADTLGVVVIGRNEGERLLVCLRSLKPHTSAVVYVDSGSSDGSAQAAREMGIIVVDLDLSIPFTAARARNAGFSELIRCFKDLRFVQFVDGDCEVVPTWLERASKYLNNEADVAIVCGRRRERFPEHSIFNYQCDEEWNTPLGITKACGGDFLCRIEAFASVGGFDPSLIAGEEPELCIRIRQKRWKIIRIDDEMTLHDANMIHFKQWCKRTMRGGYAFAEGAFLHGKQPEFHWVKETRRALLWGGLLPLMIIILGFCKPWGALVLLSLYPLQVIRVARKMSNHKKPWHLACLLVLSKFAEFSGVIVFWKNRLLKRQGRLIEYK